MRNCFGEFFFRSVVLEYLQGDILKDTIVTMAFLLEPSEYNIVDVDTVWRRQAVGQKVIGNYPLSEESFVIYGIHSICSCSTPWHFWLSFPFQRCFMCLRPSRSSWLVSFCQGNSWIRIAWVILKPFAIHNQPRYQDKKGQLTLWTMSLTWPSPQLGVSVDQSVMSHGIKKALDADVTKLQCVLIYHFRHAVCPAFGTFLCLGGILLQEGHRGRRIMSLLQCRL